VSLASAALVQLLEQIANAFLALDDVSRTRLEKLEGRCLCVRTSAPAETFCLVFQSGGLRVSNQELERPNVVVEGSIPALVTLLAGADPSGADLKIDGDVQLLEDFADILRDLQPDLEKHLAPLFGEKPAQMLADALSLSLRSAQSLLTGVLDTGQQQIQNATRERFLDQQRFETFQQGVQRLSLAVDRLRSRVELLESSSRDADT